MVIVGVDTGGTFADFIYKKDGKWHIYKTLLTPSNPALAVLKGLKHIGEGNKNIVHGSTVATNKNFEDILYIGRQNRHKLYNLKYQKPKPLAEESFSLDCRVLSNGEILKELDEKEVKELAKILKEKNFESIAVSFLFSFVNPEHEKVVKNILENEGFFVSISSKIVPEFREYERSSTTVINAYVMLKMESYISYLEESVSKDDKIKIIQSNSGIISTQTAKKQPVRTILSGPAGGVVGALHIGKLARFDKLITFDIGGTSTDLSLIDGTLSISTESVIEGYPIKVPMINIHTIGAGGGSIAYIDKGGALQVGPESAGADPGPVCYGKGESITITDANLFLGRLIPEFFLGGNMRLYPDRVKKYIENLAKESKLGLLELAEGILEVSNTKMEKALRVISIEKGYNPAEFTLFSFGGAGGLHAVFLAKMLSIPRVLIPQNPGILSAMGMLLADTIKDYSLTVMKKEGNTSYESLSKLFEILENQAIEDMLNEGIPKDKTKFEKFLDISYQGQSFEILVPFTEKFVENFHNEHKKLYGYSAKNRKVEIVNIRLRAIGEAGKPEIKSYEDMGKIHL